MFVAMNRFKIVKGKEKDIENVRKNRDTFLADVPGFKTFNFVKGEEKIDHTLCASHSIWSSKDDFWNWTKSESFKLAHKNVGNIKIYILVHLILMNLKKFYKVISLSLTQQIPN
jgi:heme-degrading monooxygenase HmoA|tara:strand:- start:203 stop:544 length:342 start_codon:yes stop_codon:yes gene_type:complete